MSECLTFRISVRRGNKTNRSSAKAIKRSHDRGSRAERAAGSDQGVFKATNKIQQKICGLKTEENTWKRWRNALWQREDPPGRDPEGRRVPKPPDRSAAEL